MAFNRHVWVRKTLGVQKQVSGTSVEVIKLDTGAGETRQLKHLRAQVVGTSTSSAYGWVGWTLAEDDLAATEVDASDTRRFWRFTPLIPVSQQPYETRLTWQSINLGPNDTFRLMAGRFNGTITLTVVLEYWELEERA